MVLLEIMSLHIVTLLMVVEIGVGRYCYEMAAYEGCLEGKSSLVIFICI
jgi:hypothetical protein